MILADLGQDFKNDQLISFIGGIENDISWDLYQSESRASGGTTGEELLRWLFL